MLKKIRTILAIVMFVCITWLFVDFTGTAYQWFSWMPKIQLLEAILALNVVAIVFLVVGTLVFGRIYCSVICPLGIFQDVIARFNRKKNKYSYSMALSWLRYTMLGVMVVALVAGVGSVFQLLAPYSAYGRIATTMFQPIWKAGNNVLATIAEHSDSYLFYHVEQVATFGAVLIIAVVTFIVLVILALRNGRTYCNTICPVGTTLSFLARFSFLKIRFDAEKCKNCSMCSRNCKSACIDYKTHTVDYSRCVVCGNCVAKCKFDALHYTYKPLSKKTSGENHTIDASKRSFLIASALVSTAALAQKKEKLMDGGIAELEEKVAPERQTSLTPPGSLSFQSFAQHCTGCQLCVSECPNHVLRPSSDLMHLMLPEMSYERGYCRPECTRCSEVCPAGAIKPIDQEEKTSTQIGHAVWIKKNCVVLTDEVECGNCARHCPSGAIEMVPLDENDEESPMVPAINETACIGCGACEYVCPARPFSAICVEGHEVHKKI